MTVSPQISSESKYGEPPPVISSDPEKKGWMLLTSERTPVNLFVPSEHELDTTDMMIFRNGPDFFVGERDHCD